MPRVGVDEAGKGPVLGSMFAAAVAIHPSDLPDDVGDSKDIRPSRREELAETIRERAEAVGVAEIPVERIDADGTDMNSLTVAAHAAALEEVISVNFSADSSCYLDACDANAVRFERRVADAVDAAVDTADEAGVRCRSKDGGAADPGLDLRAEHGADETYPVVGAASVVAKVARDTHVDSLAERYGDVGSGYPSDPATREFLEEYVTENGALPPCARASWKTSRDALAAASQSSLGAFETGGDGEDPPA